LQNFAGGQIHYRKQLAGRTRTGEACGLRSGDHRHAPGRSTEAVAAVEAADLVLIPFEADDQDSFDGIPKTARLARSSETPAVGVLNKATPNSRGQVETARLVCEAAKIPIAPVVMHRYVQHRDANPKGLTAQE